MLSPSDPLSPYLFLIGLELLSLNIKSNPQIKGVLINETEPLINQYADDTFLLLDGSELSLKETLRDRPFNLKGRGVMVFCFVQNFFFWTTQEFEYFFFVGQSAIFFLQNLTLGYMTKTLNQIIFFFLHQNRNIFFSNIGNQNIF
jgi:hypothetical protein